MSTEMKIQCRRITNAGIRITHSIIECCCRNMIVSLGRVQVCGRINRNARCLTQLPNQSLRQSFGLKLSQFCKALCCRCPYDILAKCKYNVRVHSDTRGVVCWRTGCQRWIDIIVCPGELSCSAVIIAGNICKFIASNINRRGTAEDGVNVAV